MTTSTFCLFVHGGSAWYVFTLDVAWALTMVWINRCGRSGRRGPTSRSEKVSDGVGEVFGSHFWLAALAKRDRVRHDESQRSEETFLCSMCSLIFCIINAFLL